MHVGKLDKVADVMVRLGERIDSYSKRMGGSTTTKGAVTKDSMTKLDASPFEWFKKPKTSKEHQSNANHMWHELMGAREKLKAYDNAGKKAPYDVIAAVKAYETMFKESQRQAQNFRAAGK